MNLPSFSGLRAFAADRKANVLIIFALALLPLLGITGIAVTYSQGLAIKARLDTAADAAAIAGITAARNYLQTYSGSSNVVSQAITAAQTAAQAQFTANTGTLNVATPTMSFTVNGGNISGSVAYSYTFPTQLTSLLGRPNVTIGNTATSTLTAKTYAQVYIILDNSESMGIGATWSDQCALYNMLANYNLQPGDQAGSCTNSSSATTESGYGQMDVRYPGGSQPAALGCVLACHTASQYIQVTSGHSTSWQSVSVDTEQLARCASSPSITLRLDVAKQAIIDAINILPTDGSVEVSVFRMSDALDLVIGPTSNFAAVKTAVVGTGAVCPAPTPGQTQTSLSALTTQTGIQLGSAYTTNSTSAGSSGNPPNSVLPSGVSAGMTEGGTNITGSLSALAQYMPSGGNGWSQSSPLRYLVLVTDSVEDSVLGAFTLPSLPLTRSSFAGYFNPGSSVNWPIGEMNPSACSTFTKPTTSGGLGYQLYTLYVNYVVPPQNSTGTASQYSSQGPNVTAAFETPYHDDSFPTMFSYIGANLIPPAVTPLTSCANTPSDAFSANSPQQIETAMQQIFQAIIQSQARLTY
ncbi:MAG TPA: pilus assembly protein TadG-related protein [Methylocystis sp.]|nr:pilus assembly protein TadG-related protein [Methylocystis sp.]